MSTIKSIVEQITSGNKANLREEVNALISERAGQALEMRKAFVAKKLLGEAPVEEEVPLAEAEDIQEVSKEKLGRYIKKANVDRGASKYVQGAIDAHKSTVDYYNIDTGHDFNRKASADHNEKLEKKSLSRSMSMNKAVDKLTGKARVNAEEAEDIQEVSKEKLGNYIKLSTADAKLDAFRVGFNHAFDPTASVEGKKEIKRSAGIHKATDKLTGKARVNAEEAEDIQEISMDKMKDYHKKSKEDVSKLIDSSKKRVRGDKSEPPLVDTHKKLSNRWGGQERAIRLAGKKALS